MIEVGNESQIIFDPFCLDVLNECLWRGSLAIPLRPKAFAVLCYLLRHAGRLVTKEELLDAVWPETFVGEAVLKVTVRQIREALDDDPKSPRFIATAHRRGYRFVGRISESGQTPAGRETRANEAAMASPRQAAQPPPAIVGRDDALSRMRRWLERARSGQRQIVFVTGEAGIGKTALLDTFARIVESDRTIRVGRGQCLEQYGTSEAYMPVLEAIGRLCREDRQVVDVLRAHAPMWLMQMPSLVSASDRESLRLEVLGATRERMLREISDALEALTADQPLALLLEDLHWSDYSTLDLISYLARQRQAAKLMVIGTYRTAELTISGHPLGAVKRDLHAKQQCEELPLEYLSEEAVAEYLSVRFPANRLPPQLAGLIHERTEGNPLFMTNAVDYLVAARLIVEREGTWDLVAEIEKVEVGVPESIKQMIAKQLDQLDARQRRTLEAASVAGAEFSTLTVAAGLEEDREAVDALCDELARHGQFIQDRGTSELPGGETVTRYAFVHTLYRNVLYEEMASSKRVRLHRRVGEQEEALYGESAVEIAAGLAMHFERGSSYRRAIKYLKQAAENAIRRFAYREAVGLARRGLELLPRLPDDRERVEQELCLQLTLGVPLIAIEGYAAPDVGDVYCRARELSRQLGETPDISEVLWGLWTFHTLRTNFETARVIAEEQLRLADRLPYPGLAMRGHLALEITFMHLGEFALAREHYEKALRLYVPERHLDDAFLYAMNPGIALRCFAALTLWFLGLPDEALDRVHQALALANRLSEPHGLAHAHLFAGVLHQLRREHRMARESAEATLALSREHGLAMYEAMATALRGWALIDEQRHDEAIEQIRRGIAAQRATGAGVLLPHFLAFLAEALGGALRAEEGLDLLEEALETAQRSGEGYYEAELFRIKGEMLLARAAGRGLSRAAAGGRAVFQPEPPAGVEAEACFRRAIDVARRQAAKSWELRAATSLARLCRTQGRDDEARGLLTQVYASFTEGFDTADLRDARALLDELA